MVKECVLGIAANGAVGNSGEESKEMRKLLGEGRAEGIGVEVASNRVDDRGENG